MTKRDKVQTNQTPFILLISLASMQFTSIAAAGGSSDDEISAAVETTNHYKCEFSASDSVTTEHLVLDVEVGDGRVNHFASEWAISSDSPDLRTGYAATCVRQTESFQQTKTANYIQLRYLADESEQQDRRCEIRVWESPSTVRVKSSNCTYPCLILNIEIEKKTGACRKVN